MIGAAGAGAVGVSDTPTVAQLFDLRILPEPLVPTDGGASAPDNQALAGALSAFEKRGRSDDFSALENFISSNPNSPWRLAILTNLGLIQYRAGYFSRCIPTFRAAWDAGKETTNPKAKVLADRAAGEYVKMLARLGRYDELKSFLAEVKGRQFVGQATELMMAGIEGAATMEQRPEIAFRCGPMALGRILASQGSEKWADPAILNSRSTMKGISLSDVATLSQEVGLKYQAAKRSPGAALIIPSVIHWKVGHYAALVKQQGDRYLTQDPTFENETWHTREALEAEASGYFLVPAGKLPQGWSAVRADEAGKVFGRGTTTSENVNGTANTDDQCGGSTCSKGMAAYSFHTMLCSLRIADTPVGYRPPYGLPIDFTVDYTQREASQPANFNYTNLGPKWNINWLSYITDDPANPASASEGAGGGGSYSFANFNSTTNQFAPQFDTNSQLKRVSSSPIQYELTMPDGSKDVYAQSDGSTVNPRKVFLTQRIDPAGNASTLTYDSQLRITKITDALGQQTSLSYELASDVYKLTKVTDPFGRFATFSYDPSGRLIKITDVIGIESQFAYEGTGDFINTLTTPYGTTAFSFTVNTVNNRIRHLTATDPSGDPEVLEFRDSASGLIPNSEPAAEVPANMPVTNTYLIYRNSFHWNKKQWKDAPNDYTKAHIYHWLHDQPTSQVSRYLESEKAPLTTRVWYDYPGQSGARNIVGTQTTPSMIGRVVDGGTQLVQRTITSLGKVGSETDPLGRIVNYGYSTDGIDLLNVTHAQTGGTATLNTITYNSQHRPLTSVDAAGQPTTFTWNAVGQIASIKNAKNETTTFTYYTADVAGKQRKGRLSQVDGPLAGTADTTSFDCDAAGNVASVTGPDGYNLRFSYDALDRLTRVTFPDNTYTETVWSNLDPLTSRDRLGRLTHYIYNSIRQLEAVTDPAGRKLQYQWCNCGELTHMIDPMGRVTTWYHDILGRVTAKEYVDGSRLTYGYEPLSGRLSTITDDKGQIKRQTYNVDDTLASITYSNAQQNTPNATFMYDTDYRRVTRMVDGIGTTNYGYNPITATPTLGAGHLSSIDGPWASDTVAYTYDELGRAKTRSINSVVETTTFDAAGRISSINNVLGTFNYAYDGATPRLASITHSNGVKSAYVYLPNNQDRRLQRISNLKPDGVTPLSVFDYTYDAQGRILTWKQQQDNDSAGAKTWTLGYDNADQLTSAVIQQGATVVNNYGWTYDPAANRKSETLDGSTTSFDYNSLNELSNTSASLPTTTYEWNAENRLTAVNQGNARTEFSYDGLGRRVKIVEKTNGSVTSSSTYLWCGLEICERRDATGVSIQQRYFRQGFQGVSGTPTGVHLYTNDHLGTIRELTDTAGLLKERVNYDIWGKPTFSNGTPITSFAFTGQFFHNPTFLHLATYREYASKLGRWLSRDPATQGTAINAYAYVNNNPVSKIDPLGLEETLFDLSAKLAHERALHRSLELLDSATRAELRAKGVNLVGEKYIADMAVLAFKAEKETNPAFENPLFEHAIDLLERQTDAFFEMLDGRLEQEMFVQHRGIDLMLWRSDQREFEILRLIQSLQQKAIDDAPLQLPSCSKYRPTGTENGFGDPTHFSFFPNS